MWSFREKILQTIVHHFSESFGKFANPMDSLGLLRIPLAIIDIALGVRAQRMKTFYW